MRIREVVITALLSSVLTISMVALFLTVNQGANAAPTDQSSAPDTNIQYVSVSALDFRATEQFTRYRLDPARQTLKANLQFIAILVGILLLVTYIPIISLGLVEIFYR